MAHGIYRDAQITSVAKIEYKRGWNAAMDFIVNYINALDTEHMTKKEIRSDIVKMTNTNAR